jgi:CheY-like chemotaxis protein
MLLIYAEDDIDDYSIFTEVLSEIDSGIKCVNVVNGRELLSLLEEMANPPDAILLDLNMPIMDGKSCLTSLRADERFKHVPVHIYTTGADSRNAKDYLELGAIAYKVKPNSMAELQEFITDLIARYHN